MVNETIIERIEKFNEVAELKLQEELFGTEKEKQELKWESFSVAEIQKELSVTAEEAKLLMNCGIFKTYRAGNEYRAHKKSVEERRKIIKSATTYRDKKTISVMELGRLLGLGKTAVYRLVNKCWFKTYLILGVMRIDVESFEDWYAGQFHYKKVTGERPGKKYGLTMSTTTVEEVLGIPRSSGRDLISDEKIPYTVIDGVHRVSVDGFLKWYKSQVKYHMVKTISEVEGYVD